MSEVGGGFDRCGMAAPRGKRERKECGANPIQRVPTSISGGRAGITEASAAM
jgi:hypothetical protein